MKKTLLINIDYVDNSGKFWMDSSVKNLQVTQKENETIHQTIERVASELDFIEMSYKGKPQSNIYVDTKTGTKIVGYIYRCKSDIIINNQRWEKGFFDLWANISEVNELWLQDIES